MTELISDKKTHKIGKGLVDGFKENKWGSYFAHYSSFGWHIMNVSGEGKVREYLKAEGIAKASHSELVNRLQAHGYLVERESDTGTISMCIKTTYHFPTRKERIESWLPWITFIVAFIAAYPQIERLLSALLALLQGSPQ